MRHIRRGTNWGGWQTGHRRVKIETGGAEGNSTTGTTEVSSALYGKSSKYVIVNFMLQISKFMVPVHLASLPYRSLKTNPLSPWLIILVRQLRHGVSAVVVVQFSVGGDEEAVINVVEEEHSSVWVGVAVNRAITMTTVEDEEAVVVGLGGKTMINPSATETLQSTSSLNGKCWRKLTSIAWLN